MQRAAATLLLILISTTVFAQTADQRRWAVETARWLEENPLDPEAKTKTTELFKWWSEAPDLTLSVCPLFIDTRNVRVAPIVVSQGIMSAGAYLLEHPEATRAEYSLAGAEGALRAYRNAVAADPKLRDKFLDGLLEEKSRAKYVTAVVTKCEKSMKR